MSDTRLGVVAIVVEDRNSSPRINEILSDFGDIIVGRMGIPHRDRDVSVIAIIVDGTTDQIGAMTGRLGRVRNVLVKSALTAQQVANKEDEPL